MDGEAFLKGGAGRKANLLHSEKLFVKVVV